MVAASAPAGGDETLLIGFPHCPQKDVGCVLSEPHDGQRCIERCLSRCYRSLYYSPHFLHEGCIPSGRTCSAKFIVRPGVLGCLPYNLYSSSGVELCIESYCLANRQ